MFVLTAYTSLLFLIPAFLLRCWVASAIFWMIIPVSFAVHAVGGKEWRVKRTAYGRSLVLLDKVLAQAAGVATTWSVYKSTSQYLFKTLFTLNLGIVFLMYYRWYPLPPRCWVAHHATFHIVVVCGCISAYMCGA